MGNLGIWPIVLGIMGGVLRDWNLLSELYDYYIYIVEIKG